MRTKIATALLLLCVNTANATKVETPLISTNDRVVKGKYGLFLIEEGKSYFFMKFEEEVPYLSSIRTAGRVSFQILKNVSPGETVVYTLEDRQYAALTPETPIQEGYVPAHDSHDSSPHMFRTRDGAKVIVAIRVYEVAQKKANYWNTYVFLIYDIAEKKLDILKKISFIGDWRRSIIEAIYTLADCGALKFNECLVRVGE